MRAFSYSKAPEFPNGDGAASHLAARRPAYLWSEKSFANVSEVAGNSRIKMQGVCKTK
jgi:hypothetical protein